MAAFVRLLMAACLAYVVVATGEGGLEDVTVAYFSDVTLACPGDETTPGARAFWILPDASLLMVDTPESAYPAHVALAAAGEVWTLNVTHVSDAQFGFYTCVTTNDLTRAVNVTRWGLNVDGADFSELEERYRNNAIVGAIAALVMLVMVSGACLVWHFRYSRRGASGSGSDGASKGAEIDDLKKPSPVHASPGGGQSSHVVHEYRNHGFDASRDLAVADIEVVVAPNDVSSIPNGAATRADDNVLSSSKGDGAGEDLEGKGGGADDTVTEEKNAEKALEEVQLDDRGEGEGERKGGEGENEGDKATCRM